MLPLIGALAALLTVASGSAAVAVQQSAQQSATDQQSAAEQQPAAPGVVSIPYEGEVEVAAASGYVITDCAPLFATGLVTACAPNGFTASAPAFDPEAAPVRVEVGLANASTVLAVDYVLQLEPPPAPDLPDTELMLGLGDGDRSLIPLSMLGLECELCTPGTARIEIVKAPPSSRIRASVTGAHLVLTPTRGFTGSGEIGLRIVDDLGQRSKTAIVTAHAAPSGSIPALALHRQLEMPGETIEIPAADTVPAIDAAGSGGVSVVRCGGAVRGAAVCRPGGAIEYTPVGAESDQIWAQVADRSGWQGLVSVTFREPGAAPLAALAPARGAEEAVLLIPTALPPDEDAEAADEAAATSALTGILDQIGART